MYTEDRWTLICDAITSLRTQIEPAAEILVVVDYNEQLRERVGHEFPDVRVVANAGDPGLSGGKNTALACASHPIVAVLDDDAVAAPGWLGSLYAHFAQPDVVAAGSAVEPRWEGERPSWFPPEFDWIVGCSYVGLPTTVAPTRNVFGGAMAMRRDAALEAGGFKSELGRVGGKPVGCEETEFCIRLRRSTPRSSIVFDPRTSIEHFIPLERATWRYFVRRCYGEGVSKAVVADLVGTDEGLASERSYLRKTIPTALRRSLRRRQVGTALALLSGVLVTGSGYAVGRARSFGRSSAA
jgi:GT2 family glycosyltransferase